jgi:hypothetical protein
MEWVVNATPRPLYPRERDPLGGWVGPRAGLEECEKPRPHRVSIPGPSSPWRVAIPTALSRPTHCKCMSVILFVLTLTSQNSWRPSIYYDLKYYTFARGCLPFKPQG